MTEPPADLPLVSLFRHNLWANLRLLDACAALESQNHASLRATAGGAYGDIYSTLTHIARAEQSYVRHLTGQQPERPLRREDTPDLRTLRDHARQSGEALIAIASRAAPTDVALLNWEHGQRRRVPAGLILAQAITHATEHREQIAAILTQQGIEPPDMSVWAYVDEHIPPAPREP